mmetsp:Transcript_23405/g.33477  ORF Transcript_23405/g.33477 Transcript_23405/m.33477 type:complete len:87 (-) Transcript_23405:2101-2361(-)
MGVSVPLGHGGGSEGWSGSGDQNTLFPLPLPNTAEYKMDMMCLHSVCFKHMPYLPGSRGAGPALPDNVMVQYLTESGQIYRPSFTK